MNKDSWDRTRDENPPSCHAHIRRTRSNYLLINKKLPRHKLFFFFSKNNCIYKLLQNIFVYKNFKPYSRNSCIYLIK